MTINGDDSGAINESHVKFRIADDGIDASTNSFVVKPNTQPLIHQFKSVAVGEVTVDLTVHTVVLI